MELEILRKKIIKLKEIMHDLINEGKESIEVEHVIALLGTL